MRHERSLERKRPAFGPPASCRHAGGTPAVPKRNGPAAEALMPANPVHPRARDYTSSFLPGMIPHEAELTAGVIIEPGKRYGFFPDTMLCIGCKACEVA